MGKRLYILRHAQALSATDGYDKNRKLSPKGEEDALALGSAMARKEYQPDFVAYSPAVRTMQTYERVMKIFGETPSTSPDMLYNSMAGDLISCIQDTDDQHDSLLIVAHNPGVHELVIRLLDPEHDIHLNRLAGGYQPATLCVFDCSCDKWADIQQQENQLIDVMDSLDYNAPARPTRWM